MAQKVSVTLVSDLSGEEIADGKGETVTFAIDNAQYEIDLTKKEADKFRGLFQDHIAVSRRLGRKTGTAGKRTQVGPVAKDVKAWADKQGLDYPQRGRLPKELIDQYEAAH